MAEGSWVTLLFSHWRTVAPGCVDWLNDTEDSGSTRSHTLGSLSRSGSPGQQGSGSPHSYRVAFSRAREKEA